MGNENMIVTTRREQVGEENFRVNWSIRLTECERVKFRGNILTQKVKGARISKGAV